MAKWKKGRKYCKGYSKPGGKGSKCNKTGRYTKGRKPGPKKRKTSRKTYKWVNGQLYCFKYEKGKLKGRKCIEARKWAGQGRATYKNGSMGGGREGSLFDLYKPMFGPAPFLGYVF